MNNIINNECKQNSNIFIKTRKRDKSKSDNSCPELQNIAYKTMLQNGTDILPKNQKNYNNDLIDSYLNKELAANKLQTWTKLDKTQKILKLNIYVETILKNKHNLKQEDINNCKQFLSLSLDRKSLNKTKDVIYDKDTKSITNIPNLIFIEENRKFIIRKCDKHVCTSKALVPDRKNKTIKQY